MQPIAPAFTVTSPDRLAAMAGALAWRSIFVRQKLALQTGTWAGNSQQPIEKRLNFWLAVCGCQVGGLCVLAALAWCLMSGTGVLHGCAIVLGAGIVGKVAAMLGARALFVVDALLTSRRSAP